MTRGKELPQKTSSAVDYPPRQHRRINVLVATIHTYPKNLAEIKAHR